MAVRHAEPVLAAPEQETRTTSPNALKVGLQLLQSFLASRSERKLSGQPQKSSAWVLQRLVFVAGAGLSPLFLQLQGQQLEGGNVGSPAGKD